MEAANAVGVEFGEEKLRSNLAESLVVPIVVKPLHPAKRGRTTRFE
jgi:hypothetical protein